MLAHVVPLMLAASLLSCAPLDRRSLARTPSYVDAVAHVESAARSATRSSGRLSAGWSRRAIESPPGGALAGYAARGGRPATGTDDPTFVRAFAIECGHARAVVLTADLLLVTPEVAAEVRRRSYGVIDPDALFFTASHTHSGPGGFANGFIYEKVFGPHDPRAFEAVVEAHVLAIRDAVANLAPARVGFAEIPAPELTENRVEHEGPTDDSVLAIVLEREESGASAVLWSFGCHPITRGPENMRVSADYPGLVAARLEGGTHEVVGFAAGGVGSVVPKSRGDATGIAAPLVRALERAVARARHHTRSMGTLARTAVRVPLPSPRYRAFGIPIPGALVEAGIGSDPVEFGALALDSLTLIHVPVELSGEITRRAREEARARGQTLAILPFNGDYRGYVVSPRVFALSGQLRGPMYDYETETLSFYGPRAADFIMNVALRLARGLMTSSSVDDKLGSPGKSLERERIESP